MDSDSRRARMLFEESREAVIVLDDTDTVVLASRRARQSIDGINEGATVPEGLLSGDFGIVPLIVPYNIGARRERLVYLSRPGDLTAYEELRTGFTAAVSHELRTPLARLLSLLEIATLPGEDIDGSSTAPGPRSSRRRADRRGAVPLGARDGRPGGLARPRAGPPRARGDGVGARGPCLTGRRRAPGRGRRGITLEMRPRMLRVVAQNLAENAVRYAGPGDDVHARRRA